MVKKELIILGVLITLLVVSLVVLWQMVKNGSLNKISLPSLSQSKKELIWPEYYKEVPDLGKVVRVSSQGKKTVDGIVFWEMVAENVDREKVDQYIILLKQSGFKYDDERQYGDVVEESHINGLIKVLLRYSMNAKKGKVIVSVTDR